MFFSNLNLFNMYEIQNEITSGSMETDAIKSFDYLADFESFIREFNQNMVDDEPNSNPDETMRSGDWEQEINDFIDQPSCSNFFYPNTDSVDRHLKSKGIPDVKVYLRNKLESDIDRRIRLEMFGIPVAPTASSSRSKCLEQGPESMLVEQTKRVSPDIFQETDEEEEEMCTNQNDFLLTPCKSEMNQNLVTMVEEFIMKIIQDLVSENDVKVQVANCEKWENCEVANGILNCKDRENILFRNIKLKAKKSGNHFALIIYILSEIYHLLITNTTCTERELYYKNPELTKKQTHLKSAIKDVCDVLNVSPWDLGICTSSKGLIAGAIRIHMPDDVVVDCFMNNGATLIPGNVKAISLIETTAKFVLIIEKDTIFEKLLQQNVLLNLNTDVILITGKGFPDLCTRRLVKRLWSDFHLPIYVLVDADPFGIEIMFVYRFGSKAMVLNSDQLACPQVRWIGIQPTEIEMLAIPSVSQSTRDKKKTSELLKRPYLTTEIRHELETLQRLDRKAEIEGVASFSANFLISDYIWNKVKRNFVI